MGSSIENDNTSSLSLEELLDAAIEQGDLEAIKVIRGRLKAKVVDLGPIPPKAKRKYTKTAKVDKKPKTLPKKTKAVKSSGKTPVFKNDNEYVTYMAQLADARTKLLLAHQGGSLIGAPIVSLDSPKLFKAEQEIDQKIKKSASPRVRAEYRVECRNCTSCGQSTEIPSSMIGMYNYDKGNSGSDKPNFYCGKCGV